MDANTSELVKVRTKGKEIVGFNGPNLYGMDEEESNDLGLIVVNKKRPRLSNDLCHAGVGLTQTDERPLEREFWHQQLIQWWSLGTRPTGGNDVPKLELFKC